MAANTKQHYIPKFYLRSFGHSPRKSNGTVSSISVYNISRRKFIDVSSIKNQCYRDYFYGKDLMLEKALGGLEVAASKAIKKIISDDTAPDNHTELFRIMVRFMSVQRDRTLYSLERMQEMRRKLGSISFGRNKREELDCLGAEDQTEMFRGYNILSSYILSAIMFDLQMILLVNETDIELITSDNPVVVKNTFLDPYIHMAKSGLGSAGIQIIFPLSPSRCILLLDRRAYKIRTRIKNNKCCLNELEVSNLNEFQMLCAHKNIYFRGMAGKKWIEEKSDSLIGKRRVDKVNTYEYPLLGHPSSDSIISVREPDLNHVLTMSFLGRRRRTRYKVNRRSPAPRRNDDWCEFILELRNKLMDKKISLSVYHEAVRTARPNK